MGAYRAWRCRAARAAGCRGGSGWLGGPEGFPKSVPCLVPNIGMDFRSHERNEFWFPKREPISEAASGPALGHRRSGDQAMAPKRLAALVPVSGTKKMDFNEDKTTSLLQGLGCPASSSTQHMASTKIFLLMSAAECCNEYSAIAPDIGVLIFVNVKCWCVWHIQVEFNMCTMPLCPRRLCTRRKKKERTETKKG